jgi:hypothetical protein
MALSSKTVTLVMRSYLAKIEMKLMSRQLRILKLVKVMNG